jgi:hypothetical protein
MRRREFIGVLGGAVATSSFGALAQQRVGFAETDDVWQTYLEFFGSACAISDGRTAKTSSSNIGLREKVPNARVSRLPNWLVANRICSS